MESTLKFDKTNLKLRIVFLSWTSYYGSWYLYYSYF